MADQNTSIVNNDNLLQSYFEKRAMATLHEATWFYQIAEKYPLPKGAGQQITFNGWRSLAAASTTLDEVSANSSVSLSSRKVNKTIASYGRSIKFTEMLELTSILPVEPGALRELEHSAALTVDNMVQLAVFKNVLAQVGQNASTQGSILSAFLSAKASSFCANTGTTGNGRQFGFPVVFGTSAARLSAVTSPSAGNASISARLGPIAIRKAVARLSRLNVKPLADGSYAGVAHPNAISTMLGNSDYKAWLTGYVEGPKETMYKHQVAKVHNVKLIASSNVPRSVGAGARGKKSNLTFICGMGALGVTELDGGVKMIMHRPGSQSISDAYEQYSTLAFKLRGVAAALNPSCGVIVITSEGVGEGVY